MIEKLYTKRTMVLLALFLLFISSCKKFELDSNRQPAIADAQAPSISNVSISSAAAYRGDSIDVTFTAIDDNGLYFLKVEYEPWKLLKAITLDGSQKQYTYTARIAIPANATIQSHTLKIGAIDVAYKEVSSSASAVVERKPGVYTDMYVYGDVILAGSLGKGWDYKYAEAMAPQPDGTLGLNVYNDKTNGELMLISSRNSNADILGLQSGNKLAKNAAAKIVIPAIGYYSITFNPDVMTYRVEPITATSPVTSLWIIGEGLTEFGGNDWNLDYAIPMVLSSPENPNIFIKEVTRTAAAEGVIRVLSSIAWSSQIGWVTMLDVDNIMDNTFELSRKPDKFIYIGGHQGETFVVKTDMFLNKGIAVKKP